MELLKERSDELHLEATAFKKSSTSLKNAMWWKNAKIIVIIVVLVIVIAYIIAAIVCKSPIFSGCWKHDEDAPPPGPNPP